MSMNYISGEQLDLEKRTVRRGLAVPELVDLVDDTGRIRMRAIDRNDVDQYDGLYMQIVVAVVVDEWGRILVQRRSMSKKVNPGDIDHVCGVVITGETPEQAAVRESMEETGINPHSLLPIISGVNEYNRYRYLLLGSAEGEPRIINAGEVSWVGYLYPGELRKIYTSGEFGFVDGFFHDLDLATRSQ